MAKDKYIEIEEVDHEDFLEDEEATRHQEILDQLKANAKSNSEVLKAFQEGNKAIADVAQKLISLPTPILNQDKVISSIEQLTQAINNKDNAVSKELKLQREAIEQNTASNLLLAKSISERPTEWIMTPNKNYGNITSVNLTAVKKKVYN